VNVTPTIWLITIAVTIAFFVYEFFAHVRKPHEPSIGESARWSAFYIGLALIFGVGIGIFSASTSPATSPRRPCRSTTSSCS
jgi:tellurite resistance protein TerC